MKTRKINDFDGMLEDIKESFFDCSKADLIEMIMDYKYTDCSIEDIKDDYTAFVGELVMK